MSRLIMWNLITLDGFFEGAKSWDLGWHERVWGDELERLSIEQLRSADGLLFGRVTYEGMAAHWPSAEERSPN
jgi:dihydrofolate reductase